MKPVIYLDLLFLLNFLMDSIIIYTTSLILKRTLSVMRLASAAFIAALYASVMFFPKISMFYSLFFKSVFLILPSIIAFPAKRIWAIIKNTILLCAVYAIFGGVAFMLIFTTNFGLFVGAAVSNGEIYINISSSILAISTILAYLTVYIISYTSKKNLIREQQIFTAKLFFMGKSISTRALLDTGCSLTDPLCGKGVLILDKNLAKELLPTEFLKAIEYGFSSDENYCFYKKYRILPYSTLNNAQGTMHAFIADKLTLNSTEIESAIIGISPSNLCDNHEFGAIFNPEILTEQREENQHVL